MEIKMDKNKGTIHVYKHRVTIGLVKYLIKDNDLKILQVEVKKVYQRQGIASMMIGLLVAIAGKSDCVSLGGLMLKDSYRFWKAMGFKFTCVNQMELKLDE